MNNLTGFTPDYESEFLQGAIGYELEDRKLRLERAEKRYKKLIRKTQEDLRRFL